MTSHRPSIGIFLARPDRAFYMAEKLRQRGFSVVHYNTVGYKEDSYVKISPRHAVALAYLLRRTNHDIYFTSIGLFLSSVYTSIDSYGESRMSTMQLGPNGLCSRIGRRGNRF